MTDRRPPVAGDQRLETFLTANLALELAVVAGVGFVGLVVLPSWWVLLIAATVSSYAVCVWWGRALNRRGRPVAAVVASSVGYVPVGVVNALVAPFSLPLVALAALIPGLLAVPYLPRRRVRWALLGSLAVTMVVTALAVLSPGVGLEDRVDDAVLGLILVLGVPGIVALLVLIGWQNHVMLAEQTAALRRSQARLVAAADEERRRVERDLHDGAQQRLHAALVQAALAGRLLDRDPAAAEAVLASLQAELRQAVGELRELAQGLYPAVLTDHGLVEALGAVARRLPVPVAVVDSGMDRLPPDVEAAVYFCCVEALQNVVRHAGDDASATVTVETDGTGSAGMVVRFRVADDGVGFDPATVAGGQGLQNLRDRAGALGGTVEVVARPGAGTVVSGVVPLGHADVSVQTG